MLQRSLIRKTRSQTRAAAEAVGEANLQSGGTRHETNSAGSSKDEFAASLIDEERADENDCGGCSRPNRAEKFMVQCKDCARWYHFSCGRVDPKVVHQQPFSCVLCAPRNPAPAAHSDTGRTQSSSSRARRLALELQRLEEEKQLAEKAALEKLNREKEFLEKKYELLEKAASEASESKSVRSDHGSDHRILNWVREQNSAAGGVNPGGDESLLVIAAVGEVKSIGADGVRAHSTPTPAGKETAAAALKVGVSTLSDEGAVGGDVVRSKNAATDPNFQISPVNAPQALDETTPRIPNLGVVRKVLPGSYEEWRKQPSAPPVQQQYQVQQATDKQLVTQQQLQQEIESQKEREKCLIQQLRQYDEMAKLQRKREADLQKQLQLKDRREAELRTEKERELAERDAELQRLQTLQRDFEQLRISSAATGNPAGTGATISTVADVQLSTGASGNYPIQVPAPPVSETHPPATLPLAINNHSETPQPQHDEWDQYDFLSPIGGRSNYAPLSCIDVPIPPNINPPGSPVNITLPFSNTETHVAPGVQLTPIPPSNSNSPCHPPLNQQALPPYVVPPNEPQPPTLPQQIPTGIDGPGVLPLQVGPTRIQLAARHVIPKELPIFDGKAEDWPAFISSYHHSTSVCGFSQSENLLRLQKALKGDAKREVSSLLLHPTTVPQVIWALQIRFGKPEKIVDNLIEQVLSTPSPKPGQPQQMVSYGLMVQNLCGHLRAMGMEDHLANPILLRDLVTKLPEAVKLNWALYREQLPTVNLGIFGDYMAKIAFAMSNVPSASGSEPKASRNDRSKTKEKAYVNAHATMNGSSKVDGERGSRQPVKRPNTVAERSTATTKQDRSCVACGGGSHQVASCPTFKKLDQAGRWKEVLEKKLCGRCLTQHSRYPCKGRVCGIGGCQKRHHQLLHTEAPKEEEKSNETTANGVVSMHRQPTSSTLFRMLPVTLHGSKGRVNTFAFLDDGSSITMLESSLAESIGLEGTPDSLCIHWTGGIQKKYHDTQKVKLEISAVDSNKRFKAAEVYVVDKLGLPEQTLQFEQMVQRFTYLKGLPVVSFTAAAPGILIGLNNVHLLSALKLREGGDGEPIATKTRLGWTVYGSLQGGAASIPHRQMHIRARSADDELHERVREFFALESLGIALVPEAESAVDKRAKKLLEETTMRTETGRFQTGLLWKNDQVSLPNSEMMAEKRHKQLEKRLGRDPELYSNVCRQIAEMQEKGYTHKATAAELAAYDPNRTWFLPLGVVVNPKKPGKIRIIWDAKAKVNGTSLNTELMSGPDLLTALLKVMFGFREGEVALGGDIMEMFHQIMIRPEDRSAQLYKWRNSPELPLETMVMDVAIFGATCSPAHSQFVKNKNAEEHAKEYPKAAQAIQEKHYVDDYLDSFDTEEEAVQMALEVSKVHAAGGFVIRNWVSNSRTVLEQIGENNPASVKRLVGEGQYERLLGIVWDPEADVFSFALNVRDEMKALVEGVEVPTKRDMLRIVMSIYDPCGLVAAFIVHGKILVQEVWRANVDWDIKIPSGLFDRWRQWLDVLRKMGDVKIPRCYFPGYKPESLKSVELHIFVDASEQAYAACGYFRIVDQGRVRCSLVASKTKVAPLKLLSIPRLELLAAVLGVRLRKAIVKQHSLTITRTNLWSDSSTVLSWIQSDMRRYRQFVATRLGEVLDDSAVDEWFWVPSKLNVADEATKWGKGPSVDADSRWLQGPKFLYEERKEWPKDCREKVIEPAEELRPSYVCKHSVLKSTLQVERFSKWERLLRCVSYVQRYIDNLKRSCKKEPLQLGADLTAEELRKGERCIWRIVQSETYPEEVAILKHNAQPGATKIKKITSSSPLHNTTPVMDEHGVLRVDTRMAACEYATYDNIHPIILPRKHRVTHLLLESYHRAYKHANDDTVVNEVRQRFFVTQLKAAVRATRKGCMWCRVEKPALMQPRMGPLPVVRLTPFMRAFTYVGIDYFGPYLVKVGRSTAKRWVALFTCLTTRAIHLEVTSSLSTDSCKKAIRRFIACRGAPEEIYSDRGTNFIGASRELRKEIQMINQEISSTFTDANTQWKFNPPAAPHMGGCWERMVRSVKVALGSLPIERKLDEESLTTLLKEAQHMINSRPLTFVPLPTAEHEALTPNHFLLLSSTGVKQPEKDPVDSGMALRGSWNQIQHTLDGFWRRWLKEYLPTISRRTKWFHEVRSIREGDLVVLADAGVRNRWIRGVVVRTYPGKDGVPRRADVRVSGGTVMMDRAVCNLALLDVTDGATEV